MNKLIKFILKFINTIIIILLVVIAAVIIGTKISSIQLYTVLSGSMEPNYPTGSLLWVKPIDPSELVAEDVITFYLNGDTVATHRIVEIVPDEENPDEYRFRTKGDANEVVDGSLVDPESVIGTPVLTIPKLGYFASYIQTAAGRSALLIVGAVLLLFVFLSDYLIGMDDEKKQKGSSE